ncbi:MAG TPA: isopentenyl-diphosphate Delta-isomerase [Gemmatimonadaceae bacterium]|jgi:isopentenyl-diphosphate delta-isomerase|nr:isopentenyl-diphosphate Delta-isomerase [Gemmatimonadaceae bacterium]
MPARPPRTRWSPSVVTLFELVFRPWMRRRLSGVHIAGLPRAVPEDRPILFIANHLGWWDGFVLREVQRRIRPRAPLFITMTGENLRKFSALRFMGSIDVGRDSPAELRRALRFFEEQRQASADFTTVLFPQGALWPARRRPLGFRRGITTFIRVLSPVTVIPVAIDYEMFDRPTPGAFLSVGEPIVIDGEDDVVRLGSAEHLEHVLTEELDTLAEFLDWHGDDAPVFWPEAHERLPREDPNERVILVDAADRETGTAPKLAAHISGDLHRAVSVLLTDGEGRVLIQRRSLDKYHSAGMWGNTCCGHPRPGESTQAAAARRLFEEMGIRAPMEHAGTFTYRAELAHGLVEHEVDHLFVGRWTGKPNPNPTEVAEWKWMNLASLRADLSANPRTYVAWLAPVLDAAGGKMMADVS